MRTIRFALVGAGNIAEFHARALTEVVGAELVAVHSRGRESGNAFAARWNVEWIGDYKALLARRDVDAVCLTTPSGTHAELGIAAARAGKAVLCEKPLDVTPERVRALVEACEEGGVALGAIFQARFGPGARALKSAVEAGRFGSMAWASAHVPWYRDAAYYASAGWRGTWALDGGGALMNQSIHAIDLLLWLAGPVARVNGAVANALHQGLEVEDTAMAWLEFQSGALGVIQGSTACFPGEPKRVEIKGSRGAATLEDDRLVLWRFETPLEDDEAIRAASASSTLGGGGADPRAISVEGHRAQIEDFADAVRQGRATAIPGHEGARAVALIHALYQSARTGRTITLGPTS